MYVFEGGMKWNATWKLTKQIATAHMNRAVEKGNAATASSTTGEWENFQPASSQPMWKEPTIEQ